MKRIFHFITIASVLLCACAALGSAPASAKKDEAARSLHTFNAIVKELQANYVDTINYRDLVRTAIATMLSQVDPYTEYYPTGEQDELLSISSGRYAGIGSVIVKRGDNVIIHRPQWNSPSRKAGMRAGDIILTVDGDTVTPQMEVGEVSKRLRGQAGTNVSISVRRPYTFGGDSLLTFDIVRGNIEVEPLPYYGVDSAGVSYIRLTTFNEKSAREVKAAVQDMLRTPGGIKGLVLDLRDNGGGLLESAVQIVGNFVPKGTEVVRTKGRDASMQKIYKTTSKPLDTALPLVVLTDGGTASASEIVAGALQDLDRAVVVGERSYGKGLVQNTRPLPYDDILKITTGRYYIPSGRLIQAIDYSHRNPDGSVARTPDSLTNVFHTAAGREVRDGGGITPDITVESRELNRLLYNILADYWAFDYANRYAATHPYPGPSDVFVVTDSIFEDFKAFIDPSKFKYDRQCESGLEYLRKAAEIEGYMNDSVAAQFKVLEAMLRHDLNHDLDFNRPRIVEMLDTEIADRYYSDADMAKRALRGDSVMERAREIILAPSRYRELLEPAKNKADK